MLYLSIILIIGAIGLLFTIVSIEVGFCFLLLFMDSRLDDHNHRPMPKIPSASTLVKAWIYEVIFTFLKHPLRLLYLFPQNTKLKKAKHCLVLIHGYARNDKDWLYFKKLLEPKLPDDVTVAVINVAYLKNDIDRLSLHVLRELTAIKSQTGAERISLIGHSLGGVMSSYVVERFAETKKYIKDVVTIGSPLHGTKVAVFGVGDCAKVIFPGSNTLDELADKIIDSSVNYHMMASCCDHMILPWDSAIIPSKHDVAVYETTGHISLIYSEEVVDQILSWLKINK